MKGTRANVAANFAGRIWNVALSLLLIPAYIKLVGSEGYGLIAFFATVQVIVNIFDLGTSTTVSRVMARFSADPAREPETRALARTMEVTYWGIGALIGILFALAAPFIAGVLHAGALSPRRLVQALLLMAAAVVLQWPLTFYGGATMGLQRQVLWNAVNTAGLTLRGGGALLVLLFVSPTVTAFFAWQAIASAVHTAAAMVAMWRVTPRAGDPPRFRPALLRNVYRFALAVSGLSILVVLLSQIDKVVLVRTISLAAFGEYALATSVSTAIFLCVMPIADSFLPRLTQLAAGDDRGAMAATYHTVCQLMTIAVAPAVAVLVAFPDLFLRTWTRDGALASRVHLLLALLVAGQMLNVTTAMLDMLQTSYGWMKPALLTRSMALVVMGPAMAYAALRFGGYGAAAVWLAIYTMYFAVAPQLVFRKLLPAQMTRWYLQDVLLPLGAALGVCALLRSVAAPPAGWWGGAFFLAAAGVAALVAAALVVPAGQAVARSLFATLAQTQAARKALS